MFEFAQKYWKLIRPYRRELLIALVMVGIVQVMLLADPYIFKLILDEITNWNEGSTRTVASLIALMAVLGVFTTALANQRMKRLINVMLVLEREVPSLCMRKLMELSYGYHLRENTGAKMGRITRGSWRVTEVAGSLIFEVAPIIFETIIVFTVLLVLCWPIALIFLSVIPLYVWQTKYFRDRIEPLRQLRHDRYERADDIMTQAVLNVHAVQAYTQEPSENGKYQRVKNLIFTDERKEWFMLANFDWYRSSTIMLGQVAVLASGVYQFSHGAISIGTLVLFLTLSNKVYNSLYKISFMFEKIADGSESVERLIRIIEEPTEIRSRPGARKLTALEGGISFKHVSFCYPDTNNGLHGVDLSIKAGETIGICGPSGGGKSTLARLIPRFYDVCSGSIKLDGVDVRDLDLSFRRHLAVVPQEVEIFDGTIAENIAYGCPEAGQERIRHAAKIANVDEFVDQLEEGYKTRVGERGLRLSGGQRQRVGIARAILCDPAVLIFDEATSHLDPISEQLIQESIAELQGTRTMIIIAHRLGTIQDADRIVVLDGGKIVEEGTHAELMAGGELYHELATRQSTNSL
ncbi:MAG: ABC transporter ATP-binding protein [Candidatus Uhrbacteria bacterium]|nr:ABC transporter ATP-binding protein/permease [Patescibacteria group bacterium]MBU1907331.1 ABC transporter ATP-binding protein/permease [Patescibacteria group bacterium]